jgi:hypothetical protein
LCENFEYFLKSGLGAAGGIEVEVDNVLGKVIGGKVKG